MATRWLAKMTYFAYRALGKALGYSLYAIVFYGVWLVIGGLIAWGVLGWQCYSIQYAYYLHFSSFFHTNLPQRALLTTSRQVWFLLDGALGYIFVPVVIAALVRIRAEKAFLDTMNQYWQRSFLSRGVEPKRASQKADQLVLLMMRFEQGLIDEETLTKEAEAINQQP